MGYEGLGRRVRDRCGPDAEFVCCCGLRNGWRPWDRAAGGRMITTVWGRAGL